MNNETKLPQKTARFLESIAAKHEAVAHRTVYTAFDRAATLKVNPAAVAKVLVIDADKKLAMALVGGDRNLDLEKLQKIAKAKKINFAKEKIIGETFKGIDPGAIPPFSVLWGVKLYCDKKILEQPKIIISAGTYETSLKMTPGTFKKANPEIMIGNFSLSRKKPAKNGASGKKQKDKPKTAKTKKPAKTLKKRR